MGFRHWALQAVSPRKRGASLTGTRALCTNFLLRFWEQFKIYPSERRRPHVCQAQEVAFDRCWLTVSGDQSAFDEMVTLLGRITRWCTSFCATSRMRRSDAGRLYPAHRGLVNSAAIPFHVVYQIATNLARNRYWYWWRGSATIRFPDAP